MGKRLLLTVLVLLHIPVWTLEAAAENAYPKIEISVEEQGTRNVSLAMEQAHSWFIQCTLPQREGTWQYTVIQTLPPCLQYEEGSVSAYVTNPSGDRADLIMGEDYSLTSGSVHTEQGKADRISLSLNGSVEDSILHIRYRARLKAQTPVGTQIVTAAQLNCTDGSGKREVYVSEKASVSTGGIHIQLEDQLNRPLPGGKFMLARRADPEEIADERIPKELLDIGQETIAVVYERFYISEGEKSDIAVTNQQGMAAIFGLPYGTYYLVQIGDLPIPPRKVTLNEESYLTREDGWTDSSGNAADNTVRLVSGGITMPQTGGPGTLGYTASGAAVIICACVLLWYNRKPKLYI